MIFKKSLFKNLFLKEKINFEEFYKFEGILKLVNIIPFKVYCFKFFRFYLRKDLFSSHHIALLVT